MQYDDDFDKTIPIDLDLSEEKDQYINSVSFKDENVDYTVTISTAKKQPITITLRTDNGDEIKHSVKTIVSNYESRRTLVFLTPPDESSKNIIKYCLPYRENSPRLLLFDDLEKEGFVINSCLNIFIELMQNSSVSDFSEEDDELSKVYQIRIDNFLDTTTYSKKDSLYTFNFQLQFKKPEDDESKLTFEIITLTYSADDTISFILQAVNVLDPQFSRSVTISDIKLSLNNNILITFDDLFYKDITQENGFLDDDGTFLLRFSLTLTPNFNFSNFYSGAATPYTLADYSYKSTSSYENTGYVGLANQGATCYMNSVLQSLYHIPAFRKVVYSMQIPGSEDDSKSIPLNLQRLFAKMQLCKTACSTKKLTNSFGWGDAETMMQHDVQEFIRVLLDNIENKLKGSDKEGAIADLFRGKFRHFIRCLNVDYVSTREEDFYDLQMLVRDMGDLEHSFMQYTETEKLVGDNQYETDEFGKQDAEMGVEFLEFPDVLQIHLRRFEYDYDYDRLVKINDKFEFPETIDLSPFLAKDVDTKKSSVYELFGVLVHKGDATFGHYYCFLRTSTGPQWYKFDDTLVTKATKEEAIQDNFGGEDTSAGGKSYFWSYSNEKSYSGYVLVYIRKDSEDTLYEPIPDERVPESLKEYVENTKEEKETSFWTQINVSLVTDDDMKENSMMAVNGFRAVKHENCIKLDKSDSCSKLYEEVSQYLNRDASTFRLWTINNFRNINTYIENSETSTLPDCFYTVNVFVEDIDSSDVSDPTLSPNIVVGVKFFFYNEQNPIQWLGTTYIDPSKDLSENTALNDFIATRLNLPDDVKSTVEFDYFTETISEQCISLSSSLSPTDNQLSKGSIIIAQFSQSKYGLTPDIKYTFSMYEPPQKTEEELKKEELSRSNDYFDTYDLPRSKITLYTDVFKTDSPKNPMEYLKFNSGMMYLDLYSYEDRENILGRIKFPSKTPFDKVKKMISINTGKPFDPEHDTMLLYQIQVNTRNPLSKPVDVSRVPGAVFYMRDEVCFIIYSGVSESELDNMVSYRVMYAPDGYAPTLDKRVLVPKGSTVGDILEGLQKSGDIPYDGKFRALQHITQGTVYSLNDMSDSSLKQCYIVRFDRLPEDQLNFDKEINKEVTCAHAYKDLYGNPEPYGFPFVIYAIKGEKFADTKKRLKAIMKIGDANFNHLRFFLNEYEKNKSSPIDDDNELFDMYHDYDDLYVMGPLKSTEQAEGGVKFYENK